MNKVELVASGAEKTGLAKKDAEKAVQNKNGAEQYPEKDMDNKRNRPPALPQQTKTISDTQNKVQHKGKHTEHQQVLPAQHHPQSGKASLFPQREKVDGGKAQQ